MNKNTTVVEVQQTNEGAIATFKGVLVAQQPKGTDICTFCQKWQECTFAGGRCNVLS
jgi:hypothetical protein